MNFNYRDFFIHNDDLHIIKEQLSIIDEMGVSIEDALEPNAKAVWDMYKKGSDEQTIADTLKINPLTVQKIITICLMKATDDKTTVQQIANQIANKRGNIVSITTINNVLNKALGSEREREKDTHFINDAVKIYNLHKSGKHPEEIVVLVNNEKKEYFEKINLDKVNLILKVVDIAKNQMDVDGVVNAENISKQIDNKITGGTIITLIRKIDLGKPRYLHKFTEEQDAFILFKYLQKIGPRESARLFNAEFKTDLNGNPLNIKNSTIVKKLQGFINPKNKGETDISDYVLGILKKYFPKVDINDPKTKERLTHYTPPETVGGRDRTGTGTNRDMSAHLGTLPKNFNTMLPPYYKS